MDFIFDNDKFSNTYGYYKLISPYHKTYNFFDSHGNCKTKVYPDCSTSSIICRSPIFKKPGFEAVKLTTICERYFDSALCYAVDKDFIDSNPLDKNSSKEFVDLDFKVSSKKCVRLNNLDFKVSFSASAQKKRVRHDSVKRAKDSIFDYAFCNKFDYFFTGTINPKRLNSKRPADLLLPVQNWLKNYRRRYGIQYIMVAEYHKKGGIHFHGLINFGDLQLIDSGTKSYKGYKKPMRNYKAVRLGLNPSEGKTVYNIPNWRFGFTTCIATYGDSLAVSRYISKYLTKDCSKIFGKFFWHSRGLRKPEILVDNVEYESINAKEYFDCYKYLFATGKQNVLLAVPLLTDFDNVIFDGATCVSAITGEVYYCIGGDLQNRHITQSD